MITNADITLYHKYIDDNKQTRFARHVIKGVSWHSSLGVLSSDTSVVGNNVFKVRIPESATVDGVPAHESFGSNWFVDNGDYFVRGEYGEITKPSDIKVAEFGQVRGIGDNRRGGLPHIRIEGW